MAVIVAVPARLASSRLPRKLLADVGGRPLLQRVLEQCLQARRPAAVALCTDSDELAAAVASWGLAGRVPVLMTPADCASGSDRLAAALPALEALVPGCSWIVNVQGDQPFLDPHLIDSLAAAALASGPADPPVLTPIYPLAAERLHDPAVVKVVRSHGGRALLFSRNALPHVRDLPPEAWHRACPYWGHVGLYAYRLEVLRRWSSLPPSPLEQAEKLEQLRLLEADVAIACLETDADAFSVDTAAQLEEARRRCGPEGCP
ncbi:MAG: 3-deoxy-manno-octulosonate cytidylyltransferase [Synechococcus sp. Tobar2m-G35]|nr:3-deoxy-manno-octulosonate cytidylyltransferase [Synechococcus sp. Tobar2m-G35]